VRVPLGVDLATFVPASATAAAPEKHPTGVARLVHAGRLSREKEPELMLASVRELVARGCRVHLDVLGAFCGLGGCEGDLGECVCGDGGGGSGE
jgi:alpha-1,6-mannosyltransferase